MIPTPLIDTFSPDWPDSQVGFMAAVLGACVGSFLNVVAWRLPREESLLWPSSHCPRCGTSLRWWENVPVVSWIGLRGRCRHCRAPISRRYPLTESLCGGLWVLMLVAQPDAMGSLPARPLVLISGCLLVSLLLVLALIDLDQLWIPEPLCRWAVVAGWLATTGLGLQQSPAIARGLLATHLLAAALGLLGFELFSALGARCMGRPALGSGDAKVGAILGAWLGPTGLAMAALVAVFLSAVIGGLALLMGALQRHQPIPFVPYLMVGGTLIWLTGSQPWLSLLTGRA